MVIVHLLASPFFGGPEKQMLGLARQLSGTHRNVLVSFPESGKCQPFLDQVHRQGLEGWALENNYPRLRKTVDELALTLENLQAQVLTCSGYKPDLLGWRAARRVGIPVIAVSHGWTSATWKVRLNEFLDRLVLRWMDAVVCVSQAQAEKVRRARVPESKIAVIRNAVGEDAFAVPEESYRDRLRAFFVHPPRRLVGAVGRLSPEKGFDQLVEAAAQLQRRQPDIGFVIFGDGPLREPLTQSIVRHGLQDRFILAGFHADVGKYLPFLDLGVISSFTEGLPVNLLEILAAGVPMVATAVGGIPEVIEEGRSGYLVPPGDPQALAGRIEAMFQDEPLRQAMGIFGQDQVREHFTFTRMAAPYEELLQRVCSGRGQEINSGLADKMPKDRDQVAANVEVVHDSGGSSES